MKLYMLVAFLILSLLAIRRTYAQADNKGFGDFRLIAHRGGVVDEITAENSLQALEKAIACGYYRVEIDVRMSKDSVFVVHHDRDFKRYYGNDTLVTAMTWSAMRRLTGNLGNRVHSLAEILSKASGRIQVMIDLRCRAMIRSCTANSYNCWLSTACWPML